jgi:hypothetical protein
MNISMDRATRFVSVGVCRKDYNPVGGEPLVSEHRSARLNSRLHMVVKSLRFTLPGALIVVGIVVWLVHHQTRPRSPFDLALMDLERTWQPVILMPWVRYGSDFGGVPRWRLLGASSDDQIDQWFSRLSRDSIRIVAWFLLGDGRGALQFDPAGYVSGVTPTFWSDYHSVLRSAEKHNLQLVWVLTDFEIGMPAQTEDGVQVFGRAQLLEDPEKRRSLILKGLIPILKDKTGLRQTAGWIVINEPEHLLRSGYVTESAIRAFVTEVAASIKQYHPEQRVGLANVDLASMIQFSDIQPVDFLLFHHYEAYLPPPAPFVRNYLTKANRSAGSKPIFVGEFNLNSPPGLDVDRFIRTARAFGYAGAWPWSLRNRLDPVSRAGMDIEPQFAAVGAYGKSIQSLNGPEDSTDKQGRVRDWSISQLRLNLLPEVERRVTDLLEKPAYHRAEELKNKEWAGRCRSEVAKANETLKSEELEVRRAEAGIAENEHWVSRADSGALAAARIGLRNAQNWRRTAQQRQLSAQQDIEKQQRDLRTATDRDRMHAYLERATTAELAWLRNLQWQLADPSAIERAIARRF